MKTIDRRGFTLTEVLVATAVMALMLVSFLGFVMYAGDTWQRTQMSLSLVNEANMILEFIEREMAEAIEIDSPLPGALATATLRYAKYVSDFQATPDLASFSFEIDYPQSPATTTVHTRVLLGTDPRWTAATALTPPWTLGTVSGDRVLLRDRYFYEIGSHVASFTVTREGSRKLIIRLILKSTRDRDDIEKEFSVTRTVFTHH